MPGGALKLSDVRKLADTQSAFELDFPVADLPGLPTELMSGAGAVHAQLKFGREQTHAVARLALRAQVEMVCQRCMGVMQVPVAADSTVVLVESEAEAERAPVDAEVYLAADGRLNLAALVAEELLLALPIVPLHEPQARECVVPQMAEAADGTSAPQATPAVATAAAEREATQAETVRPFADLRALLEGAGPPDGKRRR